jgi:hypothetical protein
MPRRIGLATNLVAHIMMTGYPSYENFTSAALDAVAGGTTAVPPFVTNVTPPSFAWSRSSFGEEGTRFARVSWTNRASASPRYSTFSSALC